MKTTLKFIAILYVLMALSCSRTKYKGFRQYYTNFTSYYNTYFNVQYKYRVGYRESTQLASENVSDIISVFEFENDADLFKGNAKFGETTPKVSKLLALRPYNKWMDDAILIQGKINYLRGDYDSAVMLLSYVVDNYPKGYFVGHLPANRLKGYDELIRKANREKKPIKQPRFQYHFAKNEATLWLIRAYIKRKKYERAQSVIIQAEDDMSFPIQYRKDLLKTRAMLKIVQEDYSGAVEIIHKILEEKLSKKEKGRMYFILGQIHEKLGDLAAANSNYSLALKGKLRDDLEFEAKLKSLTYETKNPDEAIAKLKKMLNKGSYLNNQDKIYAAMGNLYLDKNDEPNALKNYRLALSKSKTNLQKFSIYDKIGSVYYKKPNYILSASYYDSALQVMPTDYAKKSEFTKKTEALKNLLTHYKVFYTNDSILDLAALGEDEAKNRVEKQVKKEQERIRSEEIFKETTLLTPDNKPNANSPTSTGGGSWYFSSKDNVERGKIAFQKKWGKISRTDNWYKQSSNASLATNTSSSDSKDPSAALDMRSMTAEQIAEIQVRSLPYSEDAKKPLIKDVQTSLINMARIYHYDIKDFSKAIETYELLFSKYPKDIPSEDEALYSLYRLYVEKENIASADSIKGILVSKYPKSKYTLYANNPNAKSDEEKSELAVAKTYKTIYQNYKQGHYENALQDISLLADNNRKHSLYPKILLLQAFIQSSSGMPNEFRMSLEELVGGFKDSDEGRTGKELLDILNAVNKEELKNLRENSFVPVDKDGMVINTSQQDGENKELISKPNMSSQESVEAAAAVKVEEKKLEQTFSNYQYDPSSNHYILYKLKPSLNPASAKTLTDVYIKTKWNHFKLKTEILVIGSDRYLTVGKLSTMEQAKMFLESSKSDGIMQTLYSNADSYLISTSNLDILYISSNWKSYLDFYQRYY